MPDLRIGGTRLHYDDEGSGEPVVMVMGRGAAGRVWRLHQEPALKAAGHRVVTFTNRGIPPSDPCPQGFTIDDMVADTAGLIEQLGLGPCRVVGTSLGAYVVQELMLARPELVSQGVLMATHGRTDAFRRAAIDAELSLHTAGLTLPAPYAAWNRAQRNLSPATLDDEQRLQDWLDLFEFAGEDTGPSSRVQLELTAPDGRLTAYRQIRTPTLVIAFADDAVLPPRLSREVADAIPGAVYREVKDCGHYGYLERPDAVNRLMLDFFRGAGTSGSAGR
ncbi:alpha/beta hydrolase [Streptomyces roseirectus]|uniref:Alpha/beta hydrolase n=1 Tax=Streptomyces roseirectus TaxID=2768066 RepID=A0A7H0I7Y1_9ACTN|nr:alpha/beta hydrolase [Streptomyces roseirectus]QNP68897.1 alpha/beta hydrolase [Streptomyces roseirectus]